MATKPDIQPLLLGLKIRHLRLRKGLSFQELSRSSGLSVSYLNEIEKGKKKPKPEKLLHLAKALDIPPQELQEPSLEGPLKPVEDLLKSNFLREIPFHLFGIELHKVVDIISQAPKRVSAFISTLVELARHYSLREENFYFGALRAYLEMHNNYFEELEREVERFRQESQIEIRPGQEADPVQKLQDILKHEFGFELVENGLDPWPELYRVRALCIAHKRQLLIQSRLNPTQRAFQIGKELGFQFLQLRQRAYTASLFKVESFEHVLSHFKAGYFSAALLMPKDEMSKDIQKFLRAKTFGPKDLLQWLYRYPATGEMFFQRLTNLLPQVFGLKNIFLIRVLYRPRLSKKGGIFQVDKELHLDRQHHPHANQLDEHYCRRWASIHLIQRQISEKSKTPLADLRRVQFYNTREEYLLLSIARPPYRPKGRLAAIELGILLDKKSRKKFNFPLQDIPLTIVNKTCERCPIENCNERAAAPHLVKEKLERKKMFERIDQLLKQ